MRDETAARPTAARPAGAPYDGYLLDLDGTLYRGAEVITAAPAAVARLRSGGDAVRFVTNNAARTAEHVVTRLRRMGFAAVADEVYTSSYAAARMLAERLPAASRVLVLGTSALAELVGEVGLRPVRQSGEGVSAVVQGHARETGWRELAEASVAVRAGAWWVACNTDATLPSERGELPGNGAMVAALRTATGAEPLVAGKPQAASLRMAAQAAGCERPLVVGDRLETDIAGAHAAGMDSLLVLSGVSTPQGLLCASKEQRPTHVAADVGVLADSVSACEVNDASVAGSAWQVSHTADGLLVSSTGENGAALALLRRLCPHAWASGTVTTRAADDTSRAVLSELGLPT